MSESETQWLDSARNGDPEAFSHLVETYQRPVFNLCYRMMGDAGEAEDASQEAFIRAYQSLKRYDAQRPFITWLLSIAAHYCIDQLRRKRLPSLSLEILPEEDAPDYSPSPESQTGQAEEKRAIRAILDKLNPQDRAAVIMRYWYDLSDAEIGEALSLTVSAVKSRLHRARLELARMWIDQQPQAAYSRKEAA